MTAIPSTQVVDSPAIRADQCSRITKIVARILRMKVFASDELAHAVAAEVADGLIDEWGGSMMYVPITSRRGGVSDRHAIEEMLRLRLDPSQLAPDGKAPARTIAEIARHFRVSTRTVFRVLERLRGVK